MLKFSASVLSGEAPVNDGGSLVTLMFQRRDLSLQYHLVADSTVETLVAEDAQLYLSHVQPTAVYWRCSGAPGAWRCAVLRLA